MQARKQMAESVLYVEPSRVKVEVANLNSSAIGGIEAAVARLDSWLDTMRSVKGYGGPVVHWWQQSLLYTGPGLDWRYEGIITGYLHLWERTGEGGWLAKAYRAGDDLVSGQLENGHYPASAFELNPASAGTPHEAACDAALLRLALMLRQAGISSWESYVDVARQNLRTFYIEQLWDTQTLSFRDSLRTPSFVPNKAATACEAIFLLSELDGDTQLVDQYIIPTLDRIIEYQVKGGGPLDGAIAQNSIASHLVEKYFPVYIARCIPGLVCGYRWTGRDTYIDAALRAMKFIARWADRDGSFPTVVYPDQRVNRYPSWIAPLGDVLLAADILLPYGFDADLSTTVERLLAGQDTSGGIQTARGFAAQAGGHLPQLPDVRDVMHVAGWCDKVFRWLASRSGPVLPEAKNQDFEMDCTFRGKRMTLRETPEVLEVTCKNQVCYRWQKGQTWAEIAEPEFWLR